MISMSSQANFRLNVTYEQWMLFCVNHIIVRTFLKVSSSWIRHENDQYFIAEWFFTSLVRLWTVFSFLGIRNPYRPNISYFQKNKKTQFILVHLFKSFFKIDFLSFFLNYVFIMPSVYNF